jgi:large subunit ribosomal protein L4
MNEINIIKPELDPAIWQTPYSAHAVSLTVRSYLGNQRQGTSKVKNRGEVKGSTKKIRPQKGTGGARHGSRYAPQFRGGGIAHGPTGKENYHYQVNKKVKKKALQSTLSKKNQAQEIMIIDQINLSSYKTKEANNFLTQLKVNDKKLLIIFSTLENKNEKTKKSFRNLPNVSLSNSKKVNVYEVINHSLILFTQEAFTEMEERIK